MRAVFIHEYGQLDVVEYGERPRPVADGDEVLVRVHVASINPRDWLLVRGVYPFRHLMPPFPFTLGSDMSGVVDAIGPKVERFEPGDAVFGMQSLGGMSAFAEYALFSEKVLAAKPDNVSHEDAAAVPCAGLTAYQALKKIGRVQAGDDVLINGASGGVGSYAVQFAKLLGAHVTAVSSAANAELCTSLGADRHIDYKAENFAELPTKYDVIFDAIGRSNLKMCKAVLKPTGRYITTVPNLAAAFASLKSRIAWAFFLGRQPTSHIVLAQAGGKDLEQIATWLSDGKARSLIDSRYALSKAREALERSKTWRAKGKILLNVR